MCEVIYRPLIEDMTWSYSRLESYEDCRYKWYLTYIKNLLEDDMFYASYGSYMHKLIERYYKGEIKKEDMAIEFLSKFSQEVKGRRPSGSIVDKYIRCGVEYLRSFKPFEYNMVDVEKRINFTIGDECFVGVIDFIGERDGNLCIIDNKSRDLKPRSNKKNKTQKDKELDSMLKQLYLYAEAVYQEYGKYPTKLCFNCFKSGVFIEEPFNQSAFEETIEWAKNTIEDIKSTEDFYPSQDYFLCNYLCGFNDDCCYYLENRGG